MTDQVITDPTYDEIHLALMELVQMIDTKPDLIIGLTRGGLLPAVVLSHALDVPMLPISYSAKDGNGDDKNHTNTFPTFPPELKNILVVDDICDSGYTLKEVYDILTTAGHHVSTAVLYHKQTAVFAPTFHKFLIDGDSPWIIFPWEDKF